MCVGVVESLTHTLLHNNAHTRKLANKRRVTKITRGALKKLTEHENPSAQHKEFFLTKRRSAWEKFKASSTIFAAKREACAEAQRISLDFQLSTLLCRFISLSCRTWGMGKERKKLGCNMRPCESVNDVPLSSCRSPAPLRHPLSPHNHFRCAVSPDNRPTYKAI